MDLLIKSKDFINKLKSIPIQMEYLHQKQQIYYKFLIVAP